jgi:hypothetical protein
MRGNSSDVLAQKAFWLALSATEGRIGLEINLLRPGRLLDGAVSEFSEHVFGCHRSPVDSNIMTNPSALDLCHRENDKNISVAEVMK